MTTSRHHAAPMRSRSRRSTADKIVAAGLATATCIGIVGVLGVRVIEDSASAQAAGTTQDAATQASATDVAVSSTGLTQQQLDTYAAQLQQQGKQLDAYRAKLVKAAAQLQTGGSTHATAAVNKKPAPTVKAAPKPVAKAAPKPVAKPAPKPAPAPKPQSHTKSS